MIALSTLQNAEIDGYFIQVEPYKPLNKRNDIFINLPDNTICIEGEEKYLNHELILSLFKQYGTITNFIVISGVGFLTFENGEQASKAIDEFHHPQLTIHHHAKKDIIFEASLFHEASHIYVSQLHTNNEILIRQHFSQAGTILRININEKKLINKNYFTALIQFSSVEESRKALELDQTIFPGQDLPISVLPYLNKAIHHEEMGELVVHELKPDITIESFKNECAVFGEIFACNLVPTAHQTFIGFVLYRKFHDAKQAHESEHFLNSFLLSPISNYNTVINQFNVGLFGYRWAVFPKLSQRISEENFKALIKEISPEAEIYWNPVSIFVFCFKSENILPIFKFAQEKNFVIHLYGTSLLNGFNTQLSKFPLYKDYLSRFLCVRHLQRAINSSYFRISYSQIIPVKAAFINYSAITGKSEGYGYVLLKDSSSIVTATNHNLLKFLPLGNITASLFYNKYQKIGPIPQVQVIVPFPRRETPNPRTILKEFVLENAPHDKIEELTKIIYEYLSIAEAEKLITDKAVMFTWLQKALSL